MAVFPISQIAIIKLLVYLTTNKVLKQKKYTNISCIVKN